MLVVHSQLQRGHDPASELSLGLLVPAYEVPGRADAIVAALTAEGGHTLVAPIEHGEAPILAVHDAAMLRYLERCWADWTAAGHAGQPIVPDTLPHERMRTGMGPAPEVRSASGAIGYWCFDTSTPIVAGTYAATRAAVDVALTAAEAVLGGAAAAYGLCRPPGHHTATSMFGGYCYLNNAAIAAQWLVAQGAGRVGILDVDYHHGNGTQQVFWERPDVPYASLHADPQRAYPYFTGHASEVGGGAGRGATFNQPLPAGTDDGTYLVALTRALDWLADRTDDLLVVSLGLDTYALDPIGDLALSTAAYAACGRLVARSGRRLVILQEGGYHLPTLGDNVRGWLDGASTGRTVGYPSIAT